MLTDKKVVTDPKSTSTKYGDKWNGVVPLGHAAIVYSSSQVVESGVVMGKNDWNISKGTCAVGSVSNSTVYQDEVVANWYKCNLGKPYNKNFFDLYTTTSYYCSQVVWAGFNTNYGINLNTDMYDVLVFNKSVKQAVHPTELLINDKTVVTYKNNWNY